MSVCIGSNIAEQPKSTTGRCKHTAQQQKGASKLSPVVGVGAVALVTSRNKIVNLPKNKNKNKKGSPRKKDKREIK